VKGLLIQSPGVKRRGFFNVCIPWFKAIGGIFFFAGHVKILIGVQGFLKFHDKAFRQTVPMQFDSYYPSGWSLEISIYFFWLAAVNTSGGSLTH